MSDNNFSIEERDKLKSQDNPIIMYLVVRDIGMSAGKIAAQAGHAVGMLYMMHNTLSKYDSNHQYIKIWEDWQKGAFRKVVLTANDSKWNKLKAQLSDHGITYVVVTDAGLTQVEPGTETVIGIFPMHKSSSPPVLRKLQLLK